MKVVITGGLGFIGQELAKALLKRETLSGHKIEKLVLLDVVERDTALSKDARVEVVQGNIANANEVNAVLKSDKPLSVFHLSSVMSGQGEQDFDLAHNVNLTGTLNVIENLRKRTDTPKIVFTSTCAVFGPQETVTNKTRVLPQTTYGCTKACCELLLNDYTRKGFLDARIARLPTVIVRPGKPNAAASSFCSGLFREPLQGVDVEIPVPLETKIFLTGYPSVIANLIKLHELPAEKFTFDRTAILPGFTQTVNEMIESLKKVHAEVMPKKPLGKITVKVDPPVHEIVKNWMIAGDCENAKRLELHQSDLPEVIIKRFIADFL